MESPSVSSPFHSVIYSEAPRHNKALKLAFYNTAALLFAFISIVITISSYYVLEIFIRPLIWAALCGTFLYPFKKAATTSVRNWLGNIHTNRTPFIVGLSILPFKAVDKSADFMGKIIRTNYKLMALFGVLLPLVYYIVIFHAFYQIFYVISLGLGILGDLLSFFNYPYAVWTMFLGYAVLLIFYRNSSPIFPIVIFKAISIFVWLMLSFHFVSLAGLWKVPLALILCLFIIFGVIGELKDYFKIDKFHGKDFHEISHSTLKSVVDQTFAVFGIANKDSDSNLHKSAEGLSDHNPKSLDGPKLSLLNLRKKLKMQKAAKKRIGTSDPYFIVLFWLIVLSRVWFHIWILELLPFLLFIYIFKIAYLNFGIPDLIYKKVEGLISNFLIWYNDRKDIILPGPVKRIFAIIQSGDQKVIVWTNSMMDKMMSVLIILSLIVLATVAGVFFFVQFHHESSYLLRVATDVVNRTILSNQQYLRYLNLNDSDIQTHIDSAINSAFLYGRMRISGIISSTVSNNESNATLVSQQVDKLLVHLHDAWIGKNDSASSKKNDSSSLKKSTSLSANHTKTDINFFKARLSKIKSLFSTSDLANLWNWCKGNVQMLLSLSDSLWVIIKGNMTLMFSLFTQIISVVFFSGTYLLNTVISCVIFATSLFYLLSASSEQYKLDEWLNSVSMGTQLGESINVAIRDVFGASFKMAAFYGFYTWLTHSVFGAELVFIPAALAASLGVVPFIGTYWAAVPATLELWLIQEQGILAIILFGLHLLPTYVVDTAIYSEIAGGHPYLTALSIAGGVYCIGLEGAFIGPIVLCCLMAAFGVYNSIMSSSDVEC
ncbi:transmembrane protein 245 isoform X2 [Hydra vulgaris]